MRSFKEQLEKDFARSFFNPAEFGEMHNVDGKEMLIIIDGNELAQREKRHKSMAEGLHKKQLLIYVRAGDFGEVPLIGRMLELDGEFYSVTDVTDGDGIYSISLEEDGQ